MMTIFLYDYVFPILKRGWQEKCKQSDVTIQDSDWLLRMPFDWLITTFASVNTTLLNLYTIISGFLAGIYFTHKNHKQSLSPSCTSIFKNAFALSPTNATGCSLNLNSISTISGVKNGPTCKQSLMKVLVALS